MYTEKYGPLRGVELTSEIMNDSRLMRRWERENYIQGAREMNEAYDRWTGRAH